MGWDWCGSGRGVELFGVGPNLCLLGLVWAAFLGMVWAAFGHRSLVGDWRGLDVGQDLCEVGLVWVG